MNIKLGFIPSSKESMGKISKLNLPFKLSYKIANLIKEIDEKLVFFEQERVKLIKKHGIEKEDGNWSVLDKINEFTQEINELLEMEVELNTDFKLSEFPDDVIISPQDLMILKIFNNED